MDKSDKTAAEICFSRADEPFLWLKNSECFLENWMGAIQTVGIIASLIMLGIAVATLLGTFRPVIIFRFEKIEGLQGLEKLRENILIVENIGNRKARRIVLFSNQNLGLKPFNLDPGQIEPIPIYRSDVNIKKIRYRRSLRINSPFWFTLKNSEKRSVIDSIRSFIPVSDVRVPAGRKKFRKFLKNALNLKLTTDDLTISLFDLPYIGGSRIQLVSKDSNSDNIYFRSDYSSSYQEISFELTRLLGRSEILEDPKRKQWTVSREELKAVYKKHCRNWIKFDLETFAKVPIPSSEETYVLLPTENELYEISGCNDIGFSTSNEVRSIQLGKMWNQRIQISNKYIEFDDYGFIISDSRKDILISQLLEEPCGNTTVFIKDEGIFAGGEIDGARTIKLSKEASIEFMRVLLLAKSELKTSENRKMKDSLSLKNNHIYAYAYWSLKKSYLRG